MRLQRQGDVFGTLCLFLSDGERTTGGLNASTGRRRVAVAVGGRGAAGTSDVSSSLPDFLL